MAIHDQEALENWLETIGASWPDPHPDIGEPFTACSINYEAEHTLETMLPPGPRPDPFEDIYDSEGICVGERELDPVELARRIASWEAYCESYAKQGRRQIKRGKFKLSGTFQTERGVEAEGEWTGENWHWVSLSLASS